LNVFKPLIAFNLLSSIHLLADSSDPLQTLRERIKANEDKLKKYVSHSLMLVTALTPTIGYEKAAQVVYKAYQENISLREACLHLNFLSEEEFDRIVDPPR